LRAAVFGANDGLVSNLSLVMGIAGASSDNKLIVLAGIAGLLAGAFSMAAGEYISMQSQREMFEQQIAVEREEMRVMPEIEQEELAAIYRAKGVAPADAKRIAAQLMEDPVKALDTKVREELGLDPDQLGSSWGAATYSFVTFAIGAAIPLVPFLITSGQTAFVVSLGLAFVALFAVGAGVSIVTGKGVLFSGTRQVIIGAAAAAVTYGVGSLIGATVG
jgi:VIT1/CCC1 family predicted Fe2+/Mn2+ transporter